MAMGMAGAHKMTKSMVAYTAISDQHDPAGNYLCDSCAMRIPSAKPGRLGCTAVRPDLGERDGTHISATKGGCDWYKCGMPAKKSNINPHRTSKDEAGYVARGPYGCGRCRHFQGSGVDCHRVTGMGGIQPSECCNVQEGRRALHEAMGM